MPNCGTRYAYIKGCRCADCIEAKRVDSRRWREANIEKARESSRKSYAKYSAERPGQHRDRVQKWRESNRCRANELGRQSYHRRKDSDPKRFAEQARESNYRTYWANRETRLKRSKEYREANREALQQRKRAYYLANQAWIAEKGRQYRKANPDKVAMRNMTRRALKHSAAVEKVNPFEVYERDAWICHICKKAVDPQRRFPDPLAASLDHIVPLAKGGEHSYGNCATAHLSCNCRKGAKSDAV